MLESQRGKIYHYYDDQGVKRSVLLTGVGALTAGEKLLAKTDQLLTYAEKLPVEQAQLLFIGLQAVMGPAKAAVGLAGNILVSKLFGEQLAEVKNNAAVAIADSLTREDCEHLENSDEVFDALSAQGQIDQKGDVYVRGAAGLLDIALGSFGSIAGKIGSKVVGKVITVVPKDKSEWADGGAHRDTSKPVNDGFDSHHCPAKGCYKGAPISSQDGPAIKMTPEDHRKTSSYGSSDEALAYRAKQEELLSQGKLREAIDMDVQDIRTRFGDKYSEGVKQMLEYASKLNPDDFKR